MYSFFARSCFPSRMNRATTNGVISGVIVFRLTIEKLGNTLLRELQKIETEVSSAAEKERERTRVRP